MNNLLLQIISVSGSIAAVSLFLNTIEFLLYLMFEKKISLFFWWIFIITGTIAFICLIILFLIHINEEKNGNKN